MNKEKDVIIIGYTDDIGESEYNKELSYKRAKSVRDKLIELGMTNKVSYEGKGEENPKFSNSSKNKNKNRRVEISFE